MANYCRLTRLSALLLLGTLLALAACSATGTASPGTTPTSPATATPTDTPTPTPTMAVPTPTPILTPPDCNANFKDGYVSTLPEATFMATDVYAKVQLPPETRYFDNDASGGLRARQMCSAGTTDSVQTFMSQHLTQLGWKQIEVNSTGCLTGPSYGSPQCWQNGKYDLFIGINSAADWIIIFRDPDFTA